MPMPISSTGWPRSAFHALMASIRACISTAVATASAAWQPEGAGAPKMARIPSPMNSMMVPFRRSMISVISPK